MDLIPPQFSDKEIGLDTPAAAKSVTAAVVLVCPGCGCQDVPVKSAGEAVVAQCPQCQCEFDPPQEAPRGVLAAESGFQRILGKVFEHVVRQKLHQPKRLRTVKQHQPKLPGT